MPYIEPEVIEQARQIDLLTYLKNCEPHELVRISGNNYTTRTHDSLKISNGKWMWWSQRIGGYNALDYLVKVKGISFVEAVETLMGKAAVMPTLTVRSKQEEKPKVLLLPEKSKTTDKIRDYLFNRGIDGAITEECIEKGIVFESLPYHNLVFVGFDNEQKPKYASYRSTGNRRILGDCSGSDKHYSFRLADSKSKEVHLFECAIDLLSYATLVKLSGKDWREEKPCFSRRSLPSERKNRGQHYPPQPLSNTLQTDRIFRKSISILITTIRAEKPTEALKVILPKRYEILDEPPKKGKDYNDYLCIQLGIYKSKERSYER